MKSIRWMTAVLLSVAFGPAVAAAETAPSPDLRDVWQGKAGAFAQAARAGAGFSFKYDGKSAGPQLPDEWRQTVSHDARSAIGKVVWTHASGLIVTREARVFPGAGAVEYSVYFKNSSDKVLSPLSTIQALDVSFAGSVTEGSCVVSSGGGMFDAVLPPRSFAIHKNCPLAWVPDGTNMRLQTEGGRSSNRELPFFFVHNETQQAGLFVAIGWSGQWAADVGYDIAASTLRLKGRIPDLDIALEPGEEIKGPTILLGSYQGELAEGSNRLRRLIRDVYTPKLANRPMFPMAVYDHFLYVGLDFDEPLLKKLADSAAALGEEYFLLDAGWYEGPGKRYDFKAGLGNWYEVKKSALPNGLKPVADHVRAKGMKFGLWFEPERVAPGSTLAREHPEWILWEREREPESNHRDVNQGYGLLDYGRPDVQQWVREMLDHYIREYGIKYIRYDFNMDPLPYWNARDKVNRSGIAQLRHIEGLYSIIDWVRERNPDTILEGCASGGRRIDLETVRRFHTFWLSDYFFDPAIIRFHQFGINYFLPGNYNYSQYTLPMEHQQDFQADDLGFQSFFGGAFGIGGRVDRWPQAMNEKARLHVQTWKTLRRYLMEDFYSLTSQPGDLESWSGWQFHDPKDGSGFVQTFRTRTVDDEHRFVVHGLDSRTSYRFTDAYSKQSFDMTGLEATTKGIGVDQQPMSSRVFMYSKVSDAKAAHD